MKLLKYLRKLFQNLYFPLIFKKFGGKSFIESFEILTNPSKISIGKNVFIKSGARLESLGGSIEIGNGCQFEKDISITCVRSIRIGEGSLFGRNVLIVDHSHNIDDLSVSPVKSGVNNVQSVEVGKNTWIGANVVIVPGASIGEGSVVAANSLVNKSFPPFTMIAGAPAKAVKKYNQSKKTWEKLK